MNTAQFHLYERPRTVRFIETESTMAVRGLEAEGLGGDHPLRGIEFQSCKAKRILEVGCTKL